MGMLFGGWAREEEEEVRDDFGGDWNAYKQAKDRRIEEALRSTLPVKYSDSEPKVCKGDVIAVYLPPTHYVDQFYIQEIRDGKIYGQYVDGRHDGETELWDKELYLKICGINESTYGK